MRHHLFLLVIFIASAGPAFGNPVVEQARISAASVVFGCNAADEGKEFAEGFCKGFIEGVYSGVSNWCVPGNVSRGQLHDLIIAELRILNQADEADGSASDAIEAIISRRWPCE